jgi:murein L,D-transpeptidase YcbB/YkuD
VKFIFPNRYSVYLHDTPGDNLFDRLTRTLSHGCVRIEKPTEFAAYLLKGQPDWTAERIEQAMHAAREKHVKLKIPVPVHLLYWTAWADADGTVHFRDDVYRYDQVQRGLSAPIRAGLPAPNAPDVNVNEVGTGIVTNAAGLH